MVTLAEIRTIRHHINTEREQTNTLKKQYGASVVLLQQSLQVLFYDYKVKPAEIISSLPNMAS